MTDADSAVGLMNCRGSLYFMTLDTLVKAKHLEETINTLTRTTSVISAALKANRGVIVSNSMNSESALDTNVPEIRAAITGMLTGLEIHLDKCKKDLAVL